MNADSGKSEILFILRRNDCSACAGMGVQDGPEYAEVTEAVELSGDMLESFVNIKAGEVCVSNGDVGICTLWGTDILYLEFQLHVLMLW